MRIRIIGILSFCALIILGTMANQVAAQERTVGVSIGDTFRYGATFSWSSSDPNATMPPIYESVNETEWMSASVANVINTNVTVQVTTHFKNGTESTQIDIVDVDTGAGNMTNWVVAANLNVNDTLYTAGTYSTWKINETIVRTYPYATRNTNHVNVTVEANIGGDYQYASLNFYWDQATGVMVESRAVLISQPLGGFQSNMTAGLVITQTSLWVVPEFSALASVLALMITSAVAFVTHRRRLGKTKIR